MKIKHIVYALVALLIFSCSKDDEQKLSPAKFSIDQSTVDFGEVEVSTQKEVKLIVTNTGEEDLILKDYTFSGSNASAFTVNAGETEKTVEAGKTYEFPVVFKPEETGDKTAILIITSNVGEHKVTLSGKGTPEPMPVFSITPESNNFGDIEVDATASKTFKITNTGNADLIISATTLSNTTDFDTDLTNKTITSGGFYEFSVAFKPTTEGIKTATIKLTTNIGEYTVNLEGNATPKTIVNIPDANFKEALLAHGKSITGQGISVIDTNNDGEIQITEAEAYNGTIKCDSKAIYDSTGIEAFINLTKLIISRNQLTSLDVSKNTYLEYLECAINKISQLDVSHNAKLKVLYCNYNRIKSLDVSVNYYLTALYCHYNQLTRLNIFNASNGLTYMNATNNPNLSCIRVPSGFTPPNYWSKDNTASYSSICL